MTELEQGVCDRLLKEIAASDTPSRSQAIAQYKTFLEAVQLRRCVESPWRQPAE